MLPIENGKQGEIAHFVGMADAGEEISESYELFVNHGFGEFVLVRSVELSLVEDVVCFQSLYLTKVELALDFDLNSNFEEFAELGAAREIE